MGLISDELYHSLKLNCDGQYERVDTDNVLCVQSIQTYNQLVSGINRYHILERNCSSSLPTKKSGGRRRTTIEIVSQKIHEEPTFTECYNIRDTDNVKLIPYAKNSTVFIGVSYDNMQSHDQELVNYWAIDESVQESM